MRDRHDSGCRRGQGLEEGEQSGASIAHAMRYDRDRLPSPLGIRLEKGFERKAGGQGGRVRRDIR